MHFHTYTVACIANMFTIALGSPHSDVFCLVRLQTLRLFTDVWPTQKEEEEEEEDAPWWYGDQCLP